MPKLYERLRPAEQLHLAVQTKSPVRLAQTFAAFAGQFYDRSSFDALAREVSDLYEVESAEQANCFRRQLDRRLYDRYHAPVAWEIAPAPMGRAA